ncbi:MAG: c-type cytochrome [Terriglobales bacterium]
MQVSNWRYWAAPMLALAALSLTSAAALAQGAAAAAPDQAEKTAEQVFKNIQVFNGKPANELRPTMSFIASSLGVNCSFCHAQPFSADTKPTKQTARKMIRMVYAINKDNFGGRNQINCYTCHQGHSRPTSTLAIAADEPASAAPGGRGGPGGPGEGGRGGRGPGAGQAAGANRPAMPSAQSVVDKYWNAIGGAAALTAIHGETVTAQRIAYGRTTPETLTLDGNKLEMTAGREKSGYDGTQYWTMRGSAKTEAASDEVGIIQTAGELYPGAALASADLSRARVFGIQPVGGAQAYVLAVRTPQGGGRYYFDTQSGLLLRYVTSTPTFLGSLPLQVDYSDYRDVNGVKLPFDRNWSTHERQWETKVSQVSISR